MIFVLVLKALDAYEWPRGRVDRISWEGCGRRRSAVGRALTHREERDFLPHPWTQKGSYDGSEYDLGHLAHLSRNVPCTDGQVRIVEFRFNYHCFTEDQRGTDFRKRFVDPDFPDEKRVFCPYRWFLSLHLKSIFNNEIDRERLRKADGQQWVFIKRLSGISKPYAVYMKICPGAPGGPLIVLVNSAYTKTDAQFQQREERFAFLLTVAAKSGRVPE